MSIKFYVRPGDQVFRCYKKAMNRSWTPERGIDGTRDFVATEYGCKTIKIHKQEGTEYTTLVEMEFNTEKHVTMFILKWS